MRGEVFAMEYNIIYTYVCITGKRERMEVYTICNNNKIMMMMSMKTTK